MKPKILAFAGSTRKDSYNKKLVKIAIKGAEEAGAQVTFLDLKDYPMPLYDGDLEDSEGIPENGMKFMKILIDHDGLLISSPEYNSSISGVLKNSLDWASRPVKGMKPLAAFDKKIACLMAASPGNLGGLRGLVTLRSMLGNIKVMLLPDQFALSKADEAFDDNGNLANHKQQETVLKLGEALTHTLIKFNSNF